MSEEKEEKEEKKQSRYQLNLISKEFLHSSPEELLRLSETKAELYATMKTLKQTYYDVLIYRGIKELSVTETSQVLNWSESKVNLTYHRALKALEKKMGGSLYE
ncbi:RNA polymerase sigma factor [Sutcliffiella rhizosphaerae]|uniref:RNA polymerase sigma factor 70 region 4 type 2 domain-containing protein n=1 Tax=Sutcliffiella rhizosphaerae TaxID=2880967 RepID=A0ABM8YMU9_9BACI|nr:sigma factor-like helix-turn-helix DNA-binding protein [Sutcliffiella rhizosphaerae]CAG9621316.1 hypothetical protein BACCIP111883_02088 [Sutcliffiella rhizosphaerae]